jgi:mannose-6-phosphate isomerase-like protein (cupin superfamily)
MDDTKTRPGLVRLDEDRFGEARGMGISSLQFKVASDDSHGGLLVVEQTMLAKGGPPRHLHHEQEEWFRAVAGEFVVEIDGQTFMLAAGDSVLAPRKLPHTWAYVGDGIGRLLVAFSPAGMMEAFFREVTKADAMPSQDPELWRAHGMEVVGPPIRIE